MAEQGVSSITPHVRKLEAPAPLRNLQGWLIWRIEREPGTGKSLKVPYWANGQRRYGRQGSPEDRAKLVSFGAAKEAAARRGFDGVGLAMLADWGVTALDFDYCIRDDGSIPDEIADIIQDTYSEYSPSGMGIRCFIKGAVGNHKSHRDANNSWGFETFTSTGYVTFTGNPLLTTEALGLENTIADVTQAVLSLAQNRFGTSHARETNDYSVDPLDNLEPPMGLTDPEMQALLSDLDPSMGREGWVKVGMALHHETEGSDDGFELWDTWSADGHQYPGREALLFQWNSFSRRDPNRRPITMASVKKLSADARAERNEPPRSFDTLSRVVEEAREELNDAPVDPLAVGTPDGYGGKFPIYEDAAFADREPPLWTIKGVLPKADLGVLYGASGSGKSFVALDMAMAIARGVDWRGRKVRQGRVLLIVAEGGGGMSLRLRAYRDHHGLGKERLPVGIMHAIPNMLDQDDVAEVITSLAAAKGFDLIIIDTFAQVTAGANENSGEDMGKALRHCRAIRDATGAMVLLVHHSGKDSSKGARGWSGIRAAADVELEAVRPEGSPVRLLRVSKQKDGDDDLQWGFTLEKIMLGVDADNEALTSMVVVDAEVPTEQPVEDRPPPKRRLGIWEQVVVDAIGRLDPGITGMALEPLLDMVAEGVPPPEPGERDIRKANIMRALRSLSKGLDPALTLEHGHVAFCG
jgi:hypothetical protein